MCDSARKQECKNFKHYLLTMAMSNKVDLHDVLIDMYVVNILYSNSFLKTVMEWRMDESLYCHSMCFTAHLDGTNDKWASFNTLKDLRDKRNKIPKIDFWLYVQKLSSEFYTEFKMNFRCFCRCLTGAVPLLGMLGMHPPPPAMFVDFGQTTLMAHHGPRQNMCFRQCNTPRWRW